MLLYFLKICSLWWWCFCLHHHHICWHCGHGAAPSPTEWWASVQMFFLSNSFSAVSTVNADNSVSVVQFDQWNNCVIRSQWPIRLTSKTHCFSFWFVIDSGFSQKYSLCNEPLIELSNPGASGSLFYVSSDDEFIIKTVQHKEAEFLQKLLPGYFMVSLDSVLVNINTRRGGLTEWELLKIPV